MRIFSILRSISNHPVNRDNKWGAMLRFIRWQVGSFINPYPIVYPFTQKSKLVVQKGMRSATANYYCGLYEFNDMMFLLHFLRKDDVFLDIGANIGTYTILSSAHVQARTFAFEPVPSTFLNLMNNISLNNIHSLVTASNLAIGSKKGVVTLTDNLDTTNHIAAGNDFGGISVGVDTIDAILPPGTIPLLMKIDVEGYEIEVVQGALKTLQSKHLQAIIIELNGSGKRYGVEDSVIHQILLENGFKAYSYAPDTRKLHLLDKTGKLNTIYARDIEFVEQRLKTAPNVIIRDKSF